VGIRCCTPALCWKDNLVVAGEANAGEGVNANVWSLAARASRSDDAMYSFIL
jgi:hypothetical protein